MDTNNLGEELTSLIEPELSDIPSFAERMEESEWASAASVVHTEEERAAVIEAAKSGAKYTLIRNGSSFSLIRKNGEESIIEKLILGGKEVPYTKGPGNPVQQLDGSTKPSRSKAAGIPLPWYAWDAVPIEEDVNTKLRDIVPQLIKDSISRIKSIFAQTYIAPLIKSSILGGAT